MGVVWSWQTLIRNHCGCQEQIYVPIMLKWTYGLIIGGALLTTCAGSTGCGLFIDIPTEVFFGFQKLIKKSIRRKFSMWSPSTWVSIINHTGVVG